MTPSTPEVKPSPVPEIFDWLRRLLALRCGPIVLCYGRFMSQHGDRDQKSTVDGINGTADGTVDGKKSSVDRADDDGGVSKQANEANAEDELAPTPFDHPLFLPVLLSGLTLWFGYDGFLNSDPDMLEHLTFNRVGFAALFTASIYYGFRGYKEWKEERED
jgi:hypothetical protein